MRELVSRFGAGSHLVRTPLPGADEMRVMVVVEGFTSKGGDDLNRLALNIAAAGVLAHVDDADEVHARAARRSVRGDADDIATT